VSGAADGWDLDRDQRSTVWDVVRTGRSSGDARLDAIAAYQLDGDSRTGLAGRVFVGVLILLGVAAPFAAAARTGEPWWLLTFGATGLLTITMTPLIVVEPATVRLQRLDSAQPAEREPGDPA
jgi:hypothetical protein